MKNPRQPHRDSAEDELQHYLNERPALLLKMLDIAEACWHESAEPALMHAPPQPYRLRNAS